MRCYHGRTTKENPQSKSATNFDHQRRLGKLEVRFQNKSSGDFFFAPKNSFQKWAFQFSIQFQQSKSAIKIRNNFTLRISRIEFLNRQNLAQKKRKKVMVEMGILDDFLLTFSVARATQ